MDFIPSDAMASELPDQDDVDQEFMGLRRLQRDLNIEQDPRKKHAMREDLIESLFDYERVWLHSVRAMDKPSSILIMY